MICNLKQSSSGKCIPKSSNVTKIDKIGNIKMLNSKNGRIAKIIGEKSGADKGVVKNIKYNNKFYFLYTDTFKGPEIKGNVLFKNKLNSYVSPENNNLGTVIREIFFLKKVHRTPSVPKIFISEIFKKDTTQIKLLLATEDLSKQRYSNVGKYLDTHKMNNINFLKVNITNKKDPKLEKFLSKKGLNTGYAAFLHPRFYKQNLEKWYKYNKKFLDHLFIALNRIHKLDVFHHDLHAGNVWYNGNKVMFIDFGRASNMTESFKFRTHEPNFLKNEKKEFSKEKCIYKKRMLAELSKNVLNPSGRHEFFRHDIDDKLMSEHFYDNSNFYPIVNKFKIFLAEKYAKVVFKK